MVQANQTKVHWLIGGRGRTREVATKRVTPAHLKVADQVWIATAQLHRIYPKREDFRVGEIIEQVEREGLSPKGRGSIRVHINQHCVANFPPNTGTYRMLYSTGSNTRRLFREGDACAPGRKGKILPQRDEIPLRYHVLLDWYVSVYTRKAREHSVDPLVALRGSGKALWSREHADEYVRRLREGWE